MAWISVCSYFGCQPTTTISKSSFDAWICLNIDSLVILHSGCWWSVRFWKVIVLQFKIKNLEPMSPFPCLFSVVLVQPWVFIHMLSYLFWRCLTEFLSNKYFCIGRSQLHLIWRKGEIGVYFEVWKTCNISAWKTFSFNSVLPSQCLGICARKYIYKL